ncbi:MAG: sugar phosphate isomerase/epimerase family protein [Acidimicrobiia bacterium]
MTIASELVLYAGCLPATPFREYVDAAASAGWNAISIWPHMYRRAMSREGLDVATMRRIVRDAGIKLTDLDSCGSWLPAPVAKAGEAEAPKTMRSLWTTQEFIDVAVALEADTLVAVHLSGEKIEHQVAVDGLGTLCDAAGAAGLRVALEFIPFSGIVDLRTAISIVNDVGRNNLGYVVDVCHVRRSHSDLALLAEVPADKVFSVQLGDGVREMPTDLIDEAMYHRGDPGSGDFDVPGFVAALAARGVSTRVGPEIYRRGFSERPARDVAADLIASTRAALATPSTR